MNRDFARTRAALAAYDDHQATWPALINDANLDDGAILRWDHTSRQLAADVGAAFGLDTADLNAIDTCAACVRPSPWLRALVAQ